MPLRRAVRGGELTLAIITLASCGGGGDSSSSAPSMSNPPAVDSQARVVATTGPDPASLTSANGHLYWTESGNAPLLSVPVSGGTPTVLAERMVNADGMAFAGPDIVWVDDRGGARVINRTSASGTTAMLASGFSCLASLSQLVVLGTTVYWVNCVSSGPAGFGSDSYFLTATPIAGGTSISISDGARIVGIAADSLAVYWLEVDPRFVNATIKRIALADGTVTTLANVSDFGGGFALDGGRIYYTTIPPGYPSMPGTLWAQPVAGGAATALTTVDNATALFSLSAGDGKVVWANYSGVNVIPEGGGTSSLLAASSDGFVPGYLLVNNGNAVWIDGAEAIKSIPLTGGSVTTLFDGTGSPEQVANLTANATSELYWTLTTSYGNGSRIMRLTTDGGLETALVGIASAQPPIVVNATDLYIADGMALKRLSLAGGMPEIIGWDPVLVSGESGPAQINALAIDNSNVYFDVELGDLYSIPLAGGTRTTVAGVALFNGVAVSNGVVRLGADGYVYWTISPHTFFGPPQGTEALYRAPAAGGPATLVSQFTSQSGPSDFVVDATNAYYADRSGHIFVQPLNGGPSRTLTSSVENGLVHLTLDGTNLYGWANVQILKVDVATGAITPVVEGLNGSSSACCSRLAVDSTNVYWLEQGEIRTSPK